MDVIFWAAIVVAGFGVLCLAAVTLFALVLTRYWGLRRDDGPSFWHWLTDWAMHHLPPGRFPDQLPKFVAESFAEHLQRRNEFWTTYGQVVIAILIIVVLSILLLTKTISAEAGLPILSGVSGFAIAKGISASRGISSGTGRQSE